MAGEPRTMEWWRSFFRSSGVDIFEVVQRSIVVAVLDYPNVFRLRRDEIAETLFTCHLAQRGGDGDVLSERAVDEVVDEMKRSHSDAEKRENKVDGMPSNCSYDVAEALTEEMEEESLIVREVLRIKEVLCNKEESDSVLFESLRRLELMGLSVEVLKATEIGKAVNGLRKHNSKQIRHLVRALIDGWKVLVDEWVNATAAIADNSPVSVHLPIAEEEEGLPSPPLDEGALFITQTANIQLSEFFDGMDDDGNIRNIEDQEVDLSRNSGVYDGKCEKQDYERRHMENRKPVKPQQPPHQLPIAEGKGKTKIQEPVGRQLKQQEAVTMNKQNRNDYADNLYSGRPSKHGYEQKKPFGEFKSRQQDLSVIQRIPSSATLQDKSKHSEEASDKAKLEAAKRKLHERYQEAENAKKQRTIQVMELHDIPKQANNFRQPFTKPKNNVRNWANVRR